MSQENVERIKAGFAAHNRGDLDALVELYDPEVVFETLLLGTHHGNEAIRLIYAENQKTLAGYDVVPVELIDAGDKVVAVARSVGSGPASEIAVDDPFAFVFTFKGERVVREQAFRNKEEALEAAGLTDPPDPARPSRGRRTRPPHRSPRSSPQCGRVPGVAKVLFVCLHNAGRSQMSEALFTQAAAGRHQAGSAGTAPGDRVHPEVVEAMLEVGLDLADRRPHKLSAADAEWADVVVTMGCGDECPYIPGRRYLDWELEDPSGRPIEEVRATRDEIGRRVTELLSDLDHERPG